MELGKYKISEGRDTRLKEGRRRGRVQRKRVRKLRDGNEGGKMERGKNKKGGREELVV